MEKKAKNLIQTIILLIELVLLVLITIIIVHYNIFSFFMDVSGYLNLIRSFGILAPIAFIFLQIIQVLVFIIPGEITGFIGGYLFGATFGTIYTTLGIIMGSMFAFYLARRLGRPFVQKLVGKKYIDQLDSFKESKVTFIFFMIFLLPLFPDDIFCFLAGITNMKPRTFLIIMALGRFPGYFMLGILGADLANSQITLFVIISIIALVFLGVVYLFRNKIETWFEK